MKAVHIIALILLIVGGLNWLLVGIVGYDISNWLGGMTATLPRVIYILVGVAALIEIFAHKSTCRACDSKGQTM